MPTAYELIEQAGELISAGYDTPEELEEAIEWWAESTDDKLAAYGAIAQRMAHEIELCRDQRDKWDKKRRMLEARAEDVKVRAAELALALDALTGKMPKGVSVRTSYKVDDFDVSAIPAEYIEETLVRSIDKRGIKDAILAGVEVPGAQLIETRRASWR